MRSGRSSWTLNSTESCGRKRLSRPSPESIFTTRTREYTSAQLAEPNYSPQIQNTILGPAGPASGPRWPKTTSWKFQTECSEWNGSTFYARTAAVISATSSTMVLSLLDSDTV